jgi:hypothetical protein
VSRLLNFVNSSFSNLNIYSYERVLHHLVSMREHRELIRDSPAFTLLLHQVRSKLCPLTPGGKRNMQYDSEWVQLVAFDSILTSLIKLGEPELASHIACMAYPVESETSVADFVNAIRNNSRYNKYPHNIGTRKVVEKLIPGILEGELRRVKFSFLLPQPPAPAFVKHTSNAFKP